MYHLATRLLQTARNSRLDPDSLQRFTNQDCLEKAGLSLALPCVVTAPAGVPGVTKQAFPSSLTMTRPREPETADSLTDSAEESQAGAALGSQESARVNAELRHFTTG